MRYQDPNWFLAGSLPFRPFDSSLWAAWGVLIPLSAIVSFFLESRKIRGKWLYFWRPFDLWKKQVDKIVDISRDRVGHYMVKVRWNGSVQGDVEPWVTLRFDANQENKWLEVQLAKQKRDLEQLKSEYGGKKFEEKQKYLEELLQQVDRDPTDAKVYRDAVTTEMELESWSEKIASAEELEKLMESLQKKRDQLKLKKGNKREESDMLGEMSVSDAIYGSALQTFFLNDAGEYMSGAGRIFVVVSSAVVLLLISCYTASVANFLTSQNAWLSMPNIDISKHDAEIDLHTAVTGAPHGSLVILKGTAHVQYINNNLQINTECKDDKDSKCKYLKDYYRDYNMTSDIETARKILQDTSVGAWIQGERLFEYYQSYFHNEAAEEARAKGQPLGEGKSLQCDQKWTFVGGRFMVVTIGWVYGPTFDSELKSKIDGLFQKMWDSQQLHTLWGVWVNNTDPCIRDRSAEGLSGRLSFSDFRIIFAAVGLLGFLLILFRIFEDFTGKNSRDLINFIRKLFRPLVSPCGFWLKEVPKRHRMCSTHDMVHQLVRDNRVLKNGGMSDLEHGKPKNIAAHYPPFNTLSLSLSLSRALFETFKVQCPSTFTI